MRRTLALVGELARRRSDATLLGALGSAPSELFALPETFDYIKLPAIGMRDYYDNDGGSTADPHAPESVYSVREAILSATVDTFAPHLVVIDHEPAGFADELKPALARLRARVPRPRIVLGLRDITFGPDETREMWQESGVYELLDNVYDRILVYGCREVFDPIREYGFSARAAAKTTFTGYIRHAGAELLGGVGERRSADDEPVVVVTAGGGRDGAPLIGTYLAALREGRLGGVVSYVVMGPHMPAEKQAELTAAGAGLPRMTIVPSCSDLVRRIDAADVVVTMGGYNAVSEAVGAGKRPIIVPRVQISEEQIIRAERFAALGLATMVHPADLSPNRLGHAIANELGRSVSPPRILDFDGLARAGDILASAFEPWY